MVISTSALGAHADWLARGSSGDGRLTLQGADARGQDLRAARLAGAVLDACNFEGAVLGGTAWGGARATGCAFRDAVLGDANLDDAAFVDCDFRDADFSVLGSIVGAGSGLDGRGPARGTTARCRFERCDLRGSIWLDRDLAGAVFVDCRFELVAGAPRRVQDVEIDRPVLAGPDGAPRVAASDEILALWQVGAARPSLTENDKAVVHRGLRGRWRKREARAARGHAIPAPASGGVGSLADKWSEPFLPRVDPPAGELVALPAGTAPGVEARRLQGGVTRYRDGRIGFELALPSPVFLSPSEYMDASAGVVGSAILHISHAPRAREVPAVDAVADLVRDVTGEAPAPLALTGPGVLAAAAATARRDDAIRQVAAIAGGDADRASVVLVILDHAAGAIDPAMLQSVWTAVLASAEFGPANAG